jgi:hypothetical protein
MARINNLFMKNLPVFLFVITLFTAYTAPAQLNYRSTNNGGMVQFADINGKSLVNDKYDPAIEGFPFIIREWMEADLLTKNGVEVKKVKVKLNIESNELYYLDSANTAWIAEEGTVKKISCVNLLSSEKIPYVFKCGYPPVDKQNSNYYYQVLTEGKIELLKNNYKTIVSSKNDFSGEKRKEFVERSDNYVYSAKGITMLKNDKSFLMELMKDKAAGVEEFLLSNKINFKKIQDIRKLINYYNGLN